MIHYCGQHVFLRFEFLFLNDYALWHVQNFDCLICPLRELKLVFTAAHDRSEYVNGFAYLVGCITDGSDVGEKLIIRVEKPD